MSKATVLTLTQSLALDVADPDEISNYYDEIVREIGFREVLVDVDTIETQADLPRYSLASANILALEVHHSIGGRLSVETGVGLRASQGPAWRTKRGTPSAFTQDETNSDDIRLFPIPTAPAQLSVIQTFEGDVLEYLELPIALEIVHREFMRESSHQDVEFAVLAHGLSKFFINLIGTGVM